MDAISKEGPFFLQGVKFGKKIWRKSWMVLFEPSPAGIGRMELYDMRDGGGLKGFVKGRPAGIRKMDKRVIRLTDCLSITPAPGESCPTDCSAFFLNTTSCTYTVAAPTREDWISVLCKLAFQKTKGTEDARKVQADKFMPLGDNQLYSTWGAGQFQVTVQSTDASQRCRISGSYLLSSEKETISLLDLKTGEAIYRWPYRLLRRFGQVKGGIMIEAGRRCHTGEGQFIFLSKQGSQIHRAIEEAIMHQSVQDLLAQATALPQEFAPKPPSPKSKPQDRPKVKMLPPISRTQEQPRPALKCKYGQPIHKAIEEVLAHKSPQNLLPPSTPSKQTIPPPPISPKHKTKGNKHFPVNKNQERPCPPPLQKYGQPINKAIEEALAHQSPQNLLPPSTPSKQTIPTPPISPKHKTKGNKHFPVNKNQERPCPPPLQKYGQPINKAIEEALAHQSPQNLLPPSTPSKQTIPTPPISPKHKTKGNKHFPVNKNQERPCPPPLQKYGPPIHRVMEGALTRHNVQELLAPSKPARQAPPLPSPLPKTKPRDWHPPANLIQERPCPALPRRNISLPDPPSCVKSPVSSPDDVLYSTVSLQPKPRAKMNLPEVATLPSLPQHFGFHIHPDADVIAEKEREWKISQEPSESSNEEAPYTNWTAKTTAEQDQPNIEDLYSKVNFASKFKNRQTEDNERQEQPSADQQTPGITSNEIPADFKQALSSILFKELSKMPPPFPSRSHGGSCEQLDSIDEQMTD